MALLSATFGLNGLPLPEGKPWAVNLIDTDRLIRQAREARRAGAELVLVALHWGDAFDGFVLGAFIGLGFQILEDIS